MRTESVNDSAAEMFITKLEIKFDLLNIGIFAKF